jgi:hypothetical protein
MKQIKAFLSRITGKETTDKDLLLLLLALIINVPFYLVLLLFLRWVGLHIL